MQDIHDFVRKFPVKSFERNATILLQDDEPSALYAIKSGFVKGYDIDAQGAEQLVWLGSPGDLFPIMWAFNLKSQVDYFFSAFSEVELYTLPRQDFMNFMENNRSALLEMTKKLAIRLEDAIRHLNAAEKAKADEKIAHTLYFLSLRFGHLDQEDTRQIALPITHQDIASLLGLTRETVTVELKKLKDKGYIYYDKWHFVVHQDKLEEIL